MTDTRLSTDDILVRPTPRDSADEPLDLDAPPAQDDPPAPAPALSDEVPLLDDATADAFLARWSDVQSRFVDDPQEAVRDGDSLVAELVQELVQRFSAHRAGLEEQWQRGGEPDTEELRQALQQYRSFFQRLLST